MNLPTTLFSIIKKNPGISKIQACREINKRWKYYCGRRRCFANPRKRKTFKMYPCVCTFKLHQVTRAIKNLEDQNRIAIRRERKADGHNNRGWDWMQACYALEDLPQESGIQTTLEIQGGIPNAFK